MDGMWDPDREPADPPRFSVVWRGYDRHQVDECVRALRASPGRPLSEGFSASATAVPEFDVVLRGYDRHEVEQYLRQFPR